MLSSHNPLVSVVIPVYNTQSYLSECIESVINSTITALEIICVNDGSTDHSEEILDKYAKKDARIKVMTISHQGVSRARNVGLAEATGQYIYFLDSDDYISPDLFKDILTILDKRILDMINFDAYVIDENGNKLEDTMYVSKGKYLTTCSGPDYMLQRLKNHEWRANVPLTLYSRQFLKDAHLAFLEGIVHEDELFTFQCLCKAARVSCHAHQYYYRRIHPGSIMTNSDKTSSIRGYLTCIANILQETSRQKFSGELEEEVVKYLAMLYSICYENLHESMNVKINSNRDDKMIYEKTLLAFLVLFKHKNYTCKEENELLRDQLCMSQNEIMSLKAKYNAISTSTCWKATKPLRCLIDKIKRLSGYR